MRLFHALVPERADAPLAPAIDAVQRWLGTENDVFLAAPEAGEAAVLAERGVLAVSRRDSGTTALRAFCPAGDDTRGLVELLAAQFIWDAVAAAA